MRLLGVSDSKVSDTHESKRERDRKPGVEIFLVFPSPTPLRFGLFVSHLPG